MLILANEDYSGVQPNPAPIAGPAYLDYYRAALDAAGVAYDVYDVDAHGRRPPDPLGILSHYSHVVWYTGDDYVTARARRARRLRRHARTRSTPRTPSATSSTTAASCSSPARTPAASSARTRTSYNPFQAEEHTYCQNANPSCIAVQDDFLQYYLGAYRYVGGAGEDDTAQPFPVNGTLGPFDSARASRSTGRTPPRTTTTPRRC